MKIGEYWYAMQDREGEPYGFARLNVRGGGDAPRKVYDWQLRIAFTGGTYEEDRSLTLDANGKMVAAAFLGNEGEVRAERQGDHLIGAVRPAGEDERPLHLEVPDDAQSGMAFVLATDLPRESGAELSFTDFNEAAGFTDEGRATITVKERESLPVGARGSEAWRVVLTRADGRELPLWVDDDGVLVCADWGDGNFMLLHDEPTTAFFQPRPPVLAEVESDDPAALAVEGVFQGVSPADLFAWWTNPDQLVQWWPQDAAVGAGEGEPYHMEWKEPAWFLRGKITAWNPGQRLAFTWVWDHTPETPEREVGVDFEAVEGGTRIRLTHGPYDDTQGAREERLGHLNGWQFMCARLQEALANQ